MGFTPLVAEAGAKPSPWCDEEFNQAVSQYMQQPPALLATSGGKGLTVEFPYSAGSSLCEMQGDQAHPRIGSGLFLLQSFPVEPMSDASGTRLALELNSEELEHRPSGYGLGSYCYRDGCIRFTGLDSKRCIQAWPFTESLLFMRGKGPGDVHTIGGSCFVQSIHRRI